MARKIDLTFTAPQTWAHRIISAHNDEPITVMMPWGRGSGKSWFERVQGIWLMVAKWYGKERRKLGYDANGNLQDFGIMRGVRIVALCPTLKQFRDIHGIALEIENSGDWAFLGGRLNRSTLRIDWPDGSWFQPMPAANASSKSGRGIRCDVVLPDEIDDIDIEVFDSVAIPWFSENWSLKIVLGGGTPRRGRHGLLYRIHALGVSKDPDNARYYSKIATYRDSPELINAKEVEAARRMMNPATFAREWECDFDTAEGLVYPFDEDFHVREPDRSIRFQRYAVGGDHGWNDPGVLLLAGIQGHGEDATVWVLEERYHSEKPNHEWDAIVSECYRGLTGWLDPSRPDRIADYRRAGLNARPADNSIEAGVSRVAEFLFRRKVESGDDYSRLYVHPRCVNTIREFKSYRRKRDPHNQNGFLEDIEDRNNHALDSLRYLIVGEFGANSSRGNYRNETPGR